jgi:exonuclease VII large subunit
VLARGYSVMQWPTGGPPLTDPAMLAAGQALRVTMAAGVAQVTLASAAVDPSSPV